MKRAVVADIPRVVAFLEQHRARAMFPLGNLAAFGLDGNAPYAPRFWFAERDGVIADVLCVSKLGIVMPVSPSQDYAAMVAVLGGRDLAGVIAARDWARGFIAAAGLADAPATLNHDEPHLHVSFVDLDVPDGAGALRPLGDAERGVIVDWMTQYQIEGLHTPATRAADEAAASYANYIARDNHRVLIADGVPLAMTGFNARLPEMVQVGGVFTPPALRNRGYARRAVALHLAEAQAKGATDAVLFSGSDAAKRAYEAIGFRRIGDWTLVLFDGVQHV